jgi:hypothetical protein
MAKGKQMAKSGRLNASAIGNRQEAKCLEELEQHIREVLKGEVVVSWKTHRSRAGGNDFLADAAKGITGIDVAFICRFADTTELWLVQVAKGYRQKRFDSLKRTWRSFYGNVAVYYAVYGAKPKKFQYYVDLKLPGFWCLSAV